MLVGEATLIFPDKKEQVVHAGEFFYEPGNADIQARSARRSNAARRLLGCPSEERSGQRDAMRNLGRASAEAQHGTSHPAALRSFTAPRLCRGRGMMHAKTARGC
jgi:hypothetical protein